MWQSLQILNDFNTLTLKQIFWKIKTFLKKLEYCFLVESTEIENGIFPYKTALPKANIKKNRMGSTKWNDIFPVTTLFFLKILLQYKNLSWRGDWFTNHPDVHFHNFRKRWSFVWECFFPVCIPKVLCYLVKVVLSLSRFSTELIHVCKKLPIVLDCRQAKYYE